MNAYFVSHFIVFSALVLLAMFFSAVETSLLSFPRPLLQQRAQGAGLLGRAFKAWQDHPNRILTSILIGANITTIAATTLSAYIAVYLSDSHHWSRTMTGTVASVAVTIVIIVFGEAIPKLAGRTFSVAVAQWLVIPIYLFDMMLSPFTWIMAHTVSGLFPGLSESSVALVTEEDIKHLIDMGQEAGTIQEAEKNMIQSIFKFTDTKVGSVMIPRTAMFCVDIRTDLDSLTDLVVLHGYSRVPVFKGTIDNIVGIIQTRDLLSIWRNRELIVIQDLLHKPYFVPGSMRVDRLLQEFKRGKLHMAIVVDEYGGTAGLVTLEDLLEEIVGEIQDERDLDEEKAIVRQEDGTWVIEANIGLEDVNKALGTHLTPKGDVASLGGYLMEQLERVPRKGRVIDDLEAVFTVLEVNDRRIFRVKVKVRDVPLEAKPEPPPPKPRKRKPKVVAPPTEVSEPVVETPKEEMTESKPSEPGTTN
jgi:putative hemolysin